MTNRQSAIFAGCLFTAAIVPKVCVREFCGSPVGDTIAWTLCILTGLGIGTIYAKVLR